jgi:uncharacterized protein (DUF433 family)
MQLQDYFDFEKHQFDEIGEVDTIRFKGSRIGLEHIIEPFLTGESPERIFHGYRHALTLEQVYAAITYYLHNKEAVERYLRRGDEIADFYFSKFQGKEPSDALKRVLSLKTQKQAQSS